VRIGELAERTGTTTKTLRFYERAGLVPEPQRTAAGYRNYDEGVVVRLSFVKAAQAAGLTLAEIRGVIAVRELSGPPCQHLTALLDTHAARLDQRLGELMAMREEVEQLRERARELDPAGCTAGGVCHVIPAG
jgi:DNA-binding transcriptional MerR regulator